MMFRNYFLLLCLSIFFVACSHEPATDDHATHDDKVETEIEVETDFGGLALYTLRDTLAGDPKAVLKEVADIGYAYIEAASWSDGKFYGMAPAEFKQYLAEVGLVPVSSHMGVDNLEDVDRMIADVKAAGFEYFVIPVPPLGAFHYDSATKVMSMTEGKTLEGVFADITHIAEKVHEAGLKCLYHNHDFEFVANSDGVVPIEYMLENSDPKILNFQMDLYWVTKADKDPVDYFNRYPGRFIAWHVKDMDDKGTFAPVGEGTIDFKRIWDAREKSGMEFYLVEQDQCTKHLPIEAVKISHKGLQMIGFN